MADAEAAARFTTGRLSLRSNEKSGPLTHKQLFRSPSKAAYAGSAIQASIYPAKLADDEVG